ncbi:2-(1,2-epoxy-1,2-dihydrophenyl)acetyl-CoA isomerase [Neobacillus niacini]|uniref:enoyl-CoA hydratase/isomerase family protein n=1 Tax=Neobacillus niacini TaxID=86668 RepID=UPI00277F6BB7|nr:enoyl-CoA hydratase [Neobacillus niacini]MDQ1002190.1 2-(1,2-epoxy-1,2-dihydrophenyl)acetyl-CoA isomerase [Neobacillus niacini]
MSYKYQDIEIKNKDGICLITLNRPDRRNAIAPNIRKELIDIFKRIQHDNEISVVILTGKGNAFSAGGDLKYLQTIGTSIEGRKRMKDGQELLLAMLELDKPIIGAVNGVAVGAGFSLALACDIIIASESALFFQSFTKVGAVPDLGGAYFLSQLLGPYLAKKIMFLGEKISVKQAFDLHIVNNICSEENLMEEAYLIAKQLANGAGTAIGLTKQLINKSINGSLQEVLELEAIYQGVCFETDDFKEGVSSFLEKRSPIFSGK